MDHDAIKKSLEDALGEEIRISVPMRDYTTLRVGGVADFFYETADIDKIIQAINCCFDKKIPYIVIGGGSAVVFSDGGFPGLVIHNCSSRISFLTEKNQVIVDAGCPFARIITESASRSLSGLEWWFGIPGTIGGAIYNNSSVTGHNIAEIVKNLTLIIPPHQGAPAQVKQVSGDWMQFGQRSSRIKSWTGDKPVILTALLQLRQQRKDEIMERMQQSQKMFYPYNVIDQYFSAGSFFTWPSDFTPEFQFLINQFKLNKLHIGDATVAKDHPDFIINIGNASASDIYELKTQIKDIIKNNSGIEIEDKVEYLGVWTK